MTNSNKAKVLSESFNFDLKDLIKITGEHDVFSTTLARNLNAEIEKITSHNLMLNSELKKIKKNFLNRIFIFINKIFNKFSIICRFKI
jgi:ABC-type phosphate/phosphonate transport system ATPase subunit